jgi:cyclomaltodextrinase / maltogenic alpha-amylase / neopullulanase
VLRAKDLRYVCALAVVIVGAAACTKGSGSPTAASSNTPAPETAFTTLGGDTWSWTQKLVGTTKCSSLSLEVNGDASDTHVLVQESRFSTTLQLVPGPNKVIADCGSGEGSSAPVTFNERLTDAPQANISVSVQGNTVILDGAKSKPARDVSLKKSGGSPIKSYKWGPDPRHPEHLTTAAGAPLTHSSGKELRLQAPSADGEYYVSLEVTDSKGRTDRSVTYFEVRNGAPRVVDMAHEHPAWINKAVIYAPIPALMGGGPKSVMHKLPYLKKLGVDALWLWPPATLRTLGEEYAIDDYYKLDPDWEPKSDFEKMVDKAHELGMHVMLDFVPNHMSAKSPYYQDTKKNGKASRYWDFFDRKANGEPTHYFDWTNLPNLNYDNPEVRNMIIGAAEHWVRDMHIDGFRVDAAWGVKKRRPSFWPEFRAALKRINPDLLLLAEASAVDPYYFSHGFDLAYDWSHDLGQWAWTSAFGFPQEAGTLLKGALTNGGDGYAPNARIMRFLNNNDTGARFVDQYGVGVTRVAATMEFTLPGVPEMFTGDEIGASYEPYSNLTPIQWKDPHHLEPLYRRLIELRHTIPALTSLDMNLLDSNTDSVLAYVRPAVFGPGDPQLVRSPEPVLVILNYGDKTTVKIHSSPALDAFLGAAGGTAHDLISHKVEQLGASSGSITVTLPKETPMVLAPGAG